LFNYKKDEGNDLPSPAEQFPAGTLLFRGTNVLGSVPVHVKGINNELFLPLQRLRIKPAVDHTPQPLDLRPVPAHDERRCLGKPGKAFRITPADSGVSINGAATAAALCPRRILQPLMRGNRTGTQKKIPATNAAGIFIVFSAGLQAYACSPGYFPSARYRNCTTLLLGQLALGSVVAGAIFFATAQFIASAYQGSAPVASGLPSVR